MTGCERTPLSLLYFWRRLTAFETAEYAAARPRGASESNGTRLMYDVIIASGSQVGTTGPVPPRVWGDTGRTHHAPPRRPATLTDCHAHGRAGGTGPSVFYLSFSGRPGAPKAEGGRGKTKTRKRRGAPGPTASRVFAAFKQQLKSHYQTDSVRLPMPTPEQ